MSLGFTAGLYRPLVQRLFLQLTKAIQLGEIRCFYCRRKYKGNFFLSIQSDDFAQKVDMPALCQGCINKNESARSKQIFFIGLEDLLELLKCILSKSLKTLSEPILNQIKNHLNNLDLVPAQANPKRLLQYIQQKLQGFYLQDSDFQQYQQHSRRRTCLLLDQFYCDLHQTKAVDIFRALHDRDISLWMTSTKFMNFMHNYIAQQDAFKLQLLRQSQMLLRQTKDKQLLVKWFCKSIRGVGCFQRSFSRIPAYKQKLSYSLNRSTVMYRFVQNSQGTQQFTSVLLKTQIPFNAKPFYCRVSADQRDLIDIGLYFSKTLANQKQKVCPLFHRFCVSPMWQTGKSKIQGQSLMIQRSNQKHVSFFGNSEEQIKKPVFEFSIESQDILEMSFNYADWKFQMRNLTARSQIISQDVRHKYKGSCFVYPCFRIIGLRTVVETVDISKYNVQ